jgi:Competence protein CoiA-like family
MLIAKQGEQRVQASDAIGGIDYLCPGQRCHGPVRLRKRKGYISHFYHLDEASCSNDGESPEHEAAKIVLRDCYLKRKINAELEVYWSDYSKTLASDARDAASQKIRAQDRRCDILLQSSALGPNCPNIAIEVQGANLPDSEFNGRIHDWGLFNISVVWLALLKPTWAKKLPKSGQDITIEKIALRNFEHEMLSRYGHIWYIDPKSGCLLKGTVERHQLYKNPKDYFDSNVGEMISVEGHYYSSARWFDLTLDKPIPLEKIGLKSVLRKCRYGTVKKIYDWCELRE